MEQSATATPKEPIIVLGKQSGYLFVGRTVDRVVENTRRSLAADGSGGQDSEGSTKDRLCLDELEFFDAAGRRLELILAAGQLKVVADEDHQEEIRDRIRDIFSVAKAKIRQEPGKLTGIVDATLGLPDTCIDFEDLIRQIIFKPNGFLCEFFGTCN